MTNDLLMVGSVPYDTAEQVMRSFGGALGSDLLALPDGEVGDRKDWILRLAYQVFHGHPDVETVERPVSIDGVEQLMPRRGGANWLFKVRDGVERVTFGSHGWRLGFTKDAINSYFIFKTLREKNVFPAGVRFQVCLPLTNSAVPLALTVDHDSARRLRAGYQAALIAELAKIAELIPADDLAIQFDASWEITDVNGGVPGLPPEGAIERNVASIKALAPAVPEQALLGYHVCFGTWGGWPRFAPADMVKSVEFVNAAIAASGRRVDWVHIPTLDRSDDAFYAAFKKLKPQGARIYLGMIHNMSTFEARLAAARKVLPDFGLGAPCGFGRESPAALPGILQDHLHALEIARAHH